MLGHSVLDFSKEEILILKEQGISALHVTLKALVEDAKSANLHLGTPDFPLSKELALSLNEIIQADQAALYATYEDQTVLDIISELVVMHSDTGESIQWGGWYNHLLIPGPQNLELAASLATLLFHAGAGIGCKNPEKNALFNNKSKKPLWSSDDALLFLGIDSGLADYCWQQINHPGLFNRNLTFIYKEEQPIQLAPIKLELSKRLHPKKYIQQFLHQAETGKKYAVLSEASKSQLQQVINLLYTSELTTLVLEVVHQVAKLSPGLPVDMMMKIIGHMLCISEAETKKLYQQKVLELAMKLQSLGCPKFLSLFQAKLSGIVEINIPEEAKPTEVAKLASV